MQSPAIHPQCLNMDLAQWHTVQHNTRYGKIDTLEEKNLIIKQYIARLNPRVSINEEELQIDRSSVSN